MNRKLGAVAGAALAALSVVTISTEASARPRGVGPGIVGGLIAGAVIGTMARAAAGPYGYGYGYYAPPPAYYAPSYGYAPGPAYGEPYYGGCQWVQRGHYEEFEGVKRYKADPPVCR